MSDPQEHPTNPRQIFSATVAERYDEWYDEPWGRYADVLERKLLRRLLRPRVGETALDVGCGTGRYIRWLCELGLTAFGVDVSEPMLRASRAHRAEALPVAVADGARLPFADASFDIAAAVSALEFVENPAAVLVEMGRVTRRRLFLGVLNRRSLWARGFPRQEHGILRHARLYTPAELGELLRSTLPNCPFVLRTTLLVPEGSGSLGQGIGRVLDAMPWASLLPWGAYMGVVVDVLHHPRHRRITSPL